MNLIFIRHGETDWNCQHRIQGRTDVPLNELGREQARAIGERLATTGISAVYTSPLERAEYTGRMIAKSAGCPLYVREGITEIEFGEWEGKCMEDISRETPGRWERWGEDAYSPMAKGAETLDEIRIRTIKVVEEILESYPNDASVAITSHTMPLKTLLWHYIGVPTQAFARVRIDNCSYNMMRILPDGGARLIVLNDTEHLMKEGLICAIPLR